MELGGHIDKGVGKYCLFFLSLTYLKLTLKNFIIQLIAPKKNNQTFLQWFFPAFLILKFRRARNKRIDSIDIRKNIYELLMPLVKAA
jgi:hypothetical protein